PDPGRRRRESPGARDAGPEGADLPPRGPAPRSARAALRHAPQGARPPGPGRGRRSPPRAGVGRIPGGSLPPRRDRGRERPEPRGALEAADGTSPGLLLGLARRRPEGPGPRRPAARADDASLRGL